MGKSSLLRYLADPEGAITRNKAALQSPFRSEPSRLLMVLVEFRLLPTDAHPFVYIHDRFFAEYEGYRRMERASKTSTSPESRQITESLKPDLATVVVEDLLTELKEKGVRVAFLLDDFHLAFGRLTQIETTRLRPWRDRAAFVISTEQRLNKVNAEAAGSPFFQTLPVIPFGGLSQKEAGRLLSDTSSRGGWPFHPEDVKFMVRQAGTHPYLLIVGGRVLWEVRNSLRVPTGKKVSVSKDHPQMLLGHYIERFASTFQMYIDHLEEDERLALQATISGEVEAEHYPALAYLERLGLVEFEADGNMYRTFSPLFGEFVADTREGQPRPIVKLQVSGVEASLLEYLRLHSDRICTFEELSQNVWGELSSYSREGELFQPRIQVAVSRLRKKLQESAAGDIVSFRGKGYKLVTSSQIKAHLPLSDGSSG
jgi:DNA-binding winged helix-turn-helix (wHTH) protein